MVSFSLNSKKVFNCFLYFFLDQGITVQSVVQLPHECWLSIIYGVFEDQHQSLMICQDAWENINIFVSVESCFVTVYMFYFGRGKFGAEKKVYPFVLE